MAYNIEGLTQVFPETLLKPKRPDSIANPTLHDLLAFGTTQELADAVVLRTIPEPWWGIAAAQLPASVLIAAALGTTKGGA